MGDSPAFDKRLITPCNAFQDRQPLLHRPIGFRVDQTGAGQAVPGDQDRLTVACQIRKELGGLIHERGEADGAHAGILKGQAQRCNSAAANTPGYFSFRQFNDPRVSMVEDSTSALKPLRSRYFSVTTEPLPTIDTP